MEHNIILSVLKILISILKEKLTIMGLSDSIFLTSHNIARTRLISMQIGYMKKIGFLSSGNDGIVSSFSRAHSFI